MVIVWLSIGVGLVVVELSHLAFFARFAAIGCFAAAGVAAVWPEAIGMQVVAVLVIAIAGIIGVRPLFAVPSPIPAAHTERPECAVASLMKKSSHSTRSVTLRMSDTFAWPASGGWRLVVTALPSLPARGWS